MLQILMKKRMDRDALLELTHPAAARQGHADAQSFLGSLYYNGEGVPQDYKEAFRWFLAAAEQGNALAQ